MFSKNETRIPHSLRLAIFALRVLLGLNFFYLGFDALFNPPLGAELSKKSMGGLYASIHASSPFLWLHGISGWIFLVVGICLILGFATRLAAFVGAILATISFLPNITFSNLHLFQFANDELIIIICLIIIIFSKAGAYLGLDTFLHFSLRHRK